MVLSLLNGFIFLGIVVGRFFPKKVKLHSIWMSVFIVADIALVLYLAIARNVLVKLAPSEIYPLLVIHIIMALSCVLGYLATIHFGLKIIRGERQHIAKMRLADKIILPMRLGVFITSFYLG